MKAVILNGARAAEPDIDQMADLLTDELTAMGWDATAFTLRDYKIGYCIGCFDCWVKTPGECIIKDDNRIISETVINSDLLILLTPIVFGSYSAELKRQMDHHIPLISPFFKHVHGSTHHQPRYAHYPQLMGIGLQAQPNPAQAALFCDLVNRNAVNFQHERGYADVWPRDTPNPLAQFHALMGQVAQ